MEIEVKGNLLDYIDKDELKQEIHSQIKYQINKMLSDDKDVKELIIKSIIDEVKDVNFTNTIIDMLKLKFEQIIKNEYIDGDSFHIKYDAKIPDRIHKLFEENSEVYLPILQDKLNKTVSDFIPESYMISDIIKQLLLQDEECTSVLKESLRDRIYDIIEKI